MNIFVTLLENENKSRTSAGSLSLKEHVAIGWVGCEYAMVRWEGYYYGRGLNQQNDP
jgi:hypothetical protein